MVKKKVISLVLVLCVLCMCAAFSGCSENTTKVINDAVKKTQSLDSMHVVMDMEMNMATEGMTMSIPMVADMKASGLNGDKPVVSSVITMTMLGQESKIETYQEGEWVYTVMEDMKYKTKTEEAESEYDYSDDIKDMLQALPEELLADVKAEKGKDGSLTVSVSIPDDRFASIYGDFLKGINEESGTDVGDIKISDAVVKVTVLDGYVLAYDMQFAMTVSVDEIDTKTDVKASVAYKNPGEKVTVTPPEGYQDFEEFDLGDMGDLGDLGDLEDMEDLGDLGDLEDLGDLGDLEDLGDLGDLGDLEDLGDLGDLGDLEDLGDLGDLEGLEF